MSGVNLSPGEMPEMGDVTEMTQKLLQNRKPGLSPLQCSECDLVCPSQPVLEFHTRLHVMEKIVQTSYEYSKIYGLKKPSDNGNKQNGMNKEDSPQKSDGVKNNNAKKEKDDTQADEATDIESMMESLVSRDATDENSPKKTVEKKHKCDECGYKFANATRLKRHMMTHTGEKPYACSECDYRSARSDKLKKHMKKHDTEYKPFVCSECDYNTEEKDLYIDHMKSKHDITPEDIETGGLAEKDVSTSEDTENKNSNKEPKSIKCPDCTYECKSRSMLKSHMLKHSDERPFSCNECISRFKTRDHLKRHMLTHLKNKTKFITCTHCEFTCKNKKKLARHITAEHPGVKLHSCPLCSYKCNEEGNLVKHLKLHGDEKPYSCPEPGCDYKCKVKCNLRTHMRKHTGEQLHRCHICDYVSNLKVNVATHVAVKHSGNEKPYACEEEGCDFKCKLKSNLKVHMKTHTGEKPFVCHLCDYRSWQKGNLTIHLLKHSGEKPFVCPVCGNGYAVKGDLKTHMRIHTDDKKFMCQYCDYRCFTKQRLEIHTRKHTGEKPHECEECGFRFTSTSNLRRHLRTHYKGLAGGVKPKFISQKRKKALKTSAITGNNPVGPQGIFASQLLNDMRPSEDSSDSSQAYQTFHQGNTQPLNTQHILGANNTLGRSSQESPIPDVSYKMYPNDPRPDPKYSLTQKYGKFLPSAKPSWHEDSSSNPTATTEGYNCQLLSDLYSRKVNSHAGENLVHISQNFTHNPLAQYSRQMFVNPQDLTHLNSKIPGAMPAPTNMSEMIQHANGMYNIQ